MKAGVSTAPCASLSAPAARGAVAVRCSGELHGALFRSAWRRRRRRSGSAARSRARRRARMVSSPANAATSISRVDRGRWKLVISRSTSRNWKPGVMNRLRLAAQLARVSAGALQRAQRGGADRQHAAGRGDRVHRSRAERRSARGACGALRCGSLRTGWNVPAPTCRVSARDARAARLAGAPSMGAVEMQPGGGRGHRARAARRTRSGSARRPAASGACRM